jgi:class 3 adenylate cyclase
VSKAVQDRLRSGVQVTSMGPCHLKGFLQPVDVYGIEWR